MTCCQSCHKDVDASVVGLVVFPIGVYEFETFLVTDSDLMSVEELVGDVCEEIGCFVDCFRGGFVQILTEFSSLSMSLAVALRPGFLTMRAGLRLMFSFCLYRLIGDVIRFGFRGVDSTGVPCGFLLDFEPGVEVIGKEPCFSLVRWKMPDFVDLDYSVSHFD